MKIICCVYYGSKRGQQKEILNSCKGGTTITIKQTQKFNIAIRVI